MITLYELERELDKVKVKVEDMKKELLSFTQNEAKKAKSECLDEVKEKVEGELADVKARAEKEIKDALANSEDKIKELRAKVNRVYDQAIDVVLKAVLGE
jgi:vacuolar-type H+-ATPase subunit H